MKNKRKTILIRVEEDQAAYSAKNTKKTVMIIKSIIKEFSNENILVLGRYCSQIQFLNRTFRKKIKILNKFISSSNIDYKKRAKKALNSMEDPYTKLVKAICTLV